MRGASCAPRHSHGPGAEAPAGATRRLVASAIRGSQRTGSATVLTLKVCSVSVAFGTASFLMTDNDRTVRVDVCQRLLASLEEPAPTTTRPNTPRRLLRYRSRFAQIASAKYDEGQVRSRSQCLVVRISARSELTAGRQRQGAVWARPAPGHAISQFCLARRSRRGHA